MTSDRFPEVREADAPPETAAIYTEIRQATGLPFVNLLWRHMATLPGVLPWIWGIVGDQYRSARVAQGALVLRDAVPDLGMAPLRPAALTAAGVEDSAQRVLHDLIEAYNRGNTQNLIGWTALHHFLSGRVEGQPSSKPVPGTDLPSPLPSLPALPRIDGLDPAVLAAVDRLAARHRSFPPGTRPSLYLHLAIWPGLLRLVDDRLAPVFEADRLATAVASVSALADQEARRLTPGWSDSAEAPLDAVRAQITGTLGAFVSNAVQEMIVIGVALGRALERA